MPPTIGATYIVPVEDLAVVGIEYKEVSGDLAGEGHVAASDRYAADHRFAGLISPARRACPLWVEGDIGGTSLQRPLYSLKPDIRASTRSPRRRSSNVGGTVTSLDHATAGCAPY